MASTKDNSLYIEAPRQGIAQSPHVGYGNVVNLDITTIPGVVQLNNPLVKKSSTTVTAQPNWPVRHPVDPTQVYEIDAAGTVYKSSDSGVTWAVLSGTSSTNAHGNGMWIWKNYLFVARDALLDVCGDGTSTGITSSNWTLGWKTIDSDVLWHPMLTSKNDGKLYGGAGRFIYSLDENTGQTFAPGTGATYTWTQQALDLPYSNRIKCIAELGNNLMSGIWQGTNIYDIRVADIYPWDRSSVSFGQPIQISDFGVHAMINISESLYILAGISGTIFKSNGVGVLPVGQLPQNLSGGKYLEFYPGSIMSYKNKLFFGVGQGGSTAISGMGVYSLMETGRGNILNLEHTISTLSDGSTNILKPSTLLPISRDTCLVGWRDKATGSDVYGLDLTNNTSYAYSTDYSGYFDSPLYVLGTPKSKRSFESLEFELANLLATGEGLRISYRRNTSDTFTTIGTYTFSVAGTTILGSITSYFESSGITEGEMIQLRVALLGTSTTTPQFKILVFR